MTSVDSCQVEVNKRREAELLKLKREMDDQATQNEVTLQSMKKKLQDTTNEMSDQLDHMTKLKQKFAFRLPACLAAADV